VAKLDRLFRSVADAASIVADFDQKRIQLVAIAEGFDTTNPYGRAMAQMASVFAELERAMIRERTRNAMSVKRSRGERISERNVDSRHDLCRPKSTGFPCSSSRWRTNWRTSSQPGSGITL